MYNFIDNDEWCLESMRELKIGMDYALDTETQGMDPHSDKLLLIQVGGADGSENIFDARKISRNVMREYLSYLFSANNKLLFTNAPFDIKFILKNYNMTPPKNKIVDVALNEWVLNNGLENSYYSYKYLVKKYCNVDLDKDIREEFIGYDKEYFSDELLQYAASDVRYIFDIASAQSYYLEKNDLTRIAEIEGNATVATAEMELTGVLLDTNAWLDIYKENIEEEAIQLAKIREMVSQYKIVYHKARTGKDIEYDFSKIEFKPNSPDHVMALIIHLGLTYKGYDKKGRLIDIVPKSTNADFLKKLNHPVIEEILRCREIKKEYGTYGIKFLDHINPATGRIHGQFNQQGARSGRYSSDNPNNQNIPVRRSTKYRKCFIERDGWVQITSDYSQMEMRLAAEQSKDEVLINAFFEGKDLHALTASAMYQVPFEEVTKEQRFNGKTFNFAVLYGAQAKKVSDSLRVPIDEAKILVNNWREGFPGLAKWLDEQAKFVRENGYSATRLGRRRYFNLTDNSERWEVEEAVRQGCNHPIQGANGDIIKIALCNLHYKLFDLEANLIRTVHDEITIRAREEIAEYIKNIQRKEMEEAAKIYLKIVPVKIDTEISMYWSH